MRKNEADLKLREKTLQVDMKKKGDLARQMLSEKDVIIQQLVASSSTGGNGGSANMGSAAGSSSSGSINGFVESGPSLMVSNGERSERRQHSSDPRLSPPRGDGSSQKADPNSLQVLIGTALRHRH